MAQLFVMEMFVKCLKDCSKCKIQTEHRFVSNKTKGYYTCCICSEEASKRHRRKYWLRYLAQKANARKKEGSDKITEAILKELYKKQGYCCAISGMGFDMEKSLYRPSLDRIDSNKPYLKNNIQLVLFIVNKMKRELNESEFKNICYNISQNYNIKMFPYMYQNRSCQE